MQNWRLILLVSTFLILSQSVYAQTSITILSGTIKDQLASVIPNARITAEDRHGKSYSSMTNEDGSFELELAAGLYKIEITRESFQKFIIAEYLVGGSNMCFDVALQCKSCGEIIEHLFIDNSYKIVEPENLKVSNQILKRIMLNEMN